MTHQSSKDGVIASIQALRAFAVSWVVIDHAFPHSLPGGFIGVDVFFVISGFLITAHLLKQIETGSFTFAGFYLRRARRLLPAAVLVLAVTAVASLLLLPAAWKADTLSGIGAAAVYAVNWWLAAQSVDYFADSGVISPVNHYWSLSVEEQFYLVWPALIMITLWGVRRLPRPPSPAAAVGGLMALLAVLSFTAAVTAMQADRQAAYFFTHARAWEFAAGGIAAWAVRSGAPDRGWLRRPAARAAVLLAGWAVLLSSGWMLSPQSAVPGLAAIPVVVATALLLVLGDAHGVAPAGAVFRWGPVRRLGDVSYALYLWHWPLLVLAPFALPALEGHWALAAGAILLSLGLAGLTYRHVENRFRQTRAGTA
ncbi:MAG: acyltransferase, partial [Rhodobacteraceae bacterium]|nr:acyltransferase [Paracoccaceae bacterium]